MNRYPNITPDPCEAAYAYAAQGIAEQAGTRKSFEERVLFPVIDAVYGTVQECAAAKLDAASQHKLASELAYDVLYRLQNAGELDGEDVISWRQTDSPGEEWVEYTNASGKVFALNCPGLTHGFGSVEQNRTWRYKRLYEKSYEYEPDYGAVAIVEQLPLNIRANKVRSMRRREKIKRAIGPITVAGCAAGLTLAAWGIDQIYS